MTRGVYAQYSKMWTKRDALRDSAGCLAPKCWQTPPKYLAVTSLHLYRLHRNNAMINTTMDINICLVSCYNKQYSKTKMSRVNESRDCDPVSIRWG